MLKQVFLAHLGPVVTRFGPWKVPKRLASGPFWDQKWAPKVGQKGVFQNLSLTIWDTPTSVFSPFEPVLTWFGPWKVPKCLGNGPLCDQKWVKSGSQTRFPKYDLGPFAMLKQVVLARWAPFRHRLADGTSQIAWKMGRFGTKRSKKWVRNICFQK